LDTTSAERCVGESVFGGVCEAIKEFHLQQVAGYPATLEYIAKHREQDALSEMDVWRGVLEELLRNRRPHAGSQDASRVEPEDAFHAAEHLAVAMEFAAVDALAREGEPNGLSLADIVPHNPQPRGPRRAAADWAVRSTLFRDTPAGFRFCQRNARQWMAAFGLRGFSLTRLKSLLLADDGGLRTNHLDVAELLFKLSEREEVRTWLMEAAGGVPPSADAAPCSLEDAAEILSRLEGTAASTETGVHIWGCSDMDRLAVPGIGTVLSERIADATRTPNARRVLLEVAIGVGASTAVQPAIELVLSRHDDTLLTRLAANLVCKHGADDDILALVPFVEASGNGSQSERAASSQILLELFSRELWDFAKALEFAPAPVSMVIDATSVLAHTLEDKLDRERAVVAMRLLEARALVCEEGHQTQRGGAGRKPHPYRTYLRAVEVLLDEPDLEPAELELLSHLATRLDSCQWATHLWMKLHGAFSRNESARRELYLLDFDGAERGNRRPWSSVLCADDIGWLLSEVKRLALLDPSVQEDLLRIAHRSDSEDSDRQLVRDWFIANHPDVLGRFDERIKEGQAQQARFEEERLAAEPEEVQRFSLEPLVRDVLANKSLSPQDAMWKLSWLCFCEESFRPSNVDGNWSDLPEELQEDVINSCINALHCSDPSDLGNGNTFPSTLLYEAQCFEQVTAKDMRSRMELTPELIEKWLPGTLRASVGEWPRVVSTCAEAAADATEQVLVEQVRRAALEQPSRMSLARDVPQELWTRCFSELIRSLVTDDSLPGEARAEILRVTALRDPDEATTLLRSILDASEHLDSDASPLFETALDAALQLASDLAWPIVLKRHATLGEDALLGLASLRQHRRSDEASVLSWPSSRLGELARVLCQSFPPEGDPDLESGRVFAVTPESELRDLRGRCLWQLAERGMDEDREILLGLAGDFDWVEEWLSQVDAQKEAEMILATPVDRAIDGEALPVHRIVQLLNDDCYQIVRGGRDLLEVLREQLLAIDRDVGDDISLLYENSRDNPPKKKRRVETVLATYLRGRLRDMLPGKILDREVEVKYGRRTDIRIIAPTPNRSFATVVIEVKWSDNPSLACALTEQLGENYLLDLGLQDGIYVVGWNGHLSWRPQDKQGERPGRNPSQLHEALATQAAAFNSEHGCRIQVVVLDLTWK